MEKTKFLLFAGAWSKGSPNGLDVMKQYKIDVNSELVKGKNESEAQSRHVVELTDEQLTSLCSDPEIDVMLTKSASLEYKYLAVDTPGKGFRQR